jgi:hypothetical protein
MFVPDNTAFQKLQSMGQQNQQFGQQDLIKYHVVPQDLPVQNWQNDQLVPTLLQGQTLRLNKYPNGKVLSRFPGLCGHVAHDQRLSRQPWCRRHLSDTDLFATLKTDDRERCGG